MIPLQTKRKKSCDLVPLLHFSSEQAMHRYFGNRLVLNLYTWLSLNSELSCLYLHGQK